ncbi:MAG TPA: DUF3078 domain-containing protein [Vicingus sp.]|nr:DUF3078 domain-containing protein [Vicingus sp.]HRP60865.1 DUF3078 domain-containing protein [Vicingus sp.]
MNKFYFIVVLTAITQSLSSQVLTEEHLEAEKKLKVQKTDTIEGWKTGGVFSLNFTQVSLTNWAAGGDNSISLNGITNLFANYKKGNSTWDNTLDLAYGLMKQGKQGMRKTDDRVDFMSKYGQRAFKNWYYAALINFRTQMAPGYNYPDDSTKISNFLAPAYLLGAIGMDYKPNDNFNVFISPLTMRTTIVNDSKLADAGAFGVDKAEYNDLGEKIKNGKMFRSEYGGYLRSLLKADIMKNIKLISKLDLFSNYSDHPERIDVNWEVLIALKVNEYISATIATNLIYDHDVDIAVDENGDGVFDAFGPRTQFKEVLGIGLTYKF